MKKNKDRVEYFEDKHEYLINGVIVPSVSKLVAYATGDIYKEVPEWILEKARTHGTKIHDAIEEFERTGNVDMECINEIETYRELKKKYMLDVKSMEEIVHYKNHYCGRYDILDTDGKLWDIKTTSKYHKENLEWQLGLYYLGMGKESETGFCIHIPKKGKAKVYLVKPKTNKECEELIRTYEQSNEGSTDKSENKTISMA